MINGGKRVKFNSFNV